MNPRHNQEQIGLFPVAAPAPSAASIETVIADAQRARDVAIAAMLRGAVARIGQVVTTLLGWPERRATYDRLRRLSDRELADIGLTRAEIGRVFDPAFAPPPAANGNRGRHPQVA